MKRWKNCCNIVARLDSGEEWYGLQTWPGVRDCRSSHHGPVGALWASFWPSNSIIWDSWSSQRIFLVIGSVEVRSWARQGHWGNCTQVPRGFTVTQVRVLPERARWRDFDPVLLKTRNAVSVQSSLAANACRFLGPSFQKNPEDLFHSISYHIRDEGLVFRPKRFKHYVVIENIAH